MGPHTSLSSGAHRAIKSYVVGFISSIALTALAFLIVSKRAFGTEGLYISLALLAFVQLCVQVYFFLHLRRKNVWNIISLIFALIVVVSLLGLSMWIMYNLNHNMAIH